MDDMNDFAGYDPENHENDGEQEEKEQLLREIDDVFHRIELMDRLTQGEIQRLLDGETVQVIADDYNQFSKLKEDIARTLMLGFGAVLHVDMVHNTDDRRVNRMIVGELSASFPLLDEDIENEKSRKKDSKKKKKTKKGKHKKRKKEENIE